MIVNGLALLPLRQAEMEPFQSRRQGRTPDAPERNRNQHASHVLEQIDRVSQQISAAKAEYPSDESGAIVTALGPNLDDPNVSRQIITDSPGGELLVSDQGRVVFRVEDDLAGLRAKATAYANEDTKGEIPDTAISLPALMRSRWQRSPT